MFLQLRPVFNYFFDGHFFSIPQLEPEMTEINHGSYLNTSDADLWDSFREGKDDAFEYLYRKFYQRIYNYGRQFTADQSLVEDAIQELFIDLRRRRQYLSSTTNILPYLYNAFRRKIIRLRDNQNKNQEFDIHKSFAITISIEDEIVNRDLKEEDLKKLQKAMDGLSPKYKEVIYHFYYENLSYQEIQNVLGFDNIKSVRNLLYKALKKLRKNINLVVISIFLLINLINLKPIEQIEA